MAAKAVQWAAVYHVWREDVKSVGLLLSMHESSTAVAPVRRAKPVPVL